MALAQGESRAEHESEEGHKKVEETKGRREKANKKQRSEESNRRAQPCVAAKRPPAYGPSRSSAPSVTCKSPDSHMPMPRYLSNHWSLSSLCSASICHLALLFRTLVGLPVRP